MITIKELIQLLEKIEDKDIVAELYNAQDESFTPLDVDLQLDGTCYIIPLTK